MSTPEGKVKRKVNAALAPVARLWKFMPVQTGYGRPALDYLLCVNGRFVAIETKAKGKKPTTRQKQTTAELEAAGAKVFIVDDTQSLQVALEWINALAAGTGL